VDAQLFESLRKEYGEDEIDAWDEVGFMEMLLSNILVR
jgi:hypothetical protein